MWKRGNKVGGSSGFTVHKILSSVAVRSISSFPIWIPLISSSCTGAQLGVSLSTGFLPRPLVYEYWVQANKSKFSSSQMTHSTNPIPGAECCQLCFWNSYFTHRISFLGLSNFGGGFLNPAWPLVSFRAGEVAGSCSSIHSRPLRFLSGLVTVVASFFSHNRFCLLLLSLLLSLLCTDKHPQLSPWKNFSASLIPRLQPPFLAHWRFLCVNLRKTRYLLAQVSSIVREMPCMAGLRGLC